METENVLECIEIQVRCEHHNARVPEKQWPLLDKKTATFQVCISKFWAVLNNAASLMNNCNIALM